MRHTRHLGFGLLLGLLVLGGSARRPARAADCVCTFASRGGGGKVRAYSDGTIEGSKSIFRQTLAKHDGAVNAVAFGDKLCLSGAADGTLKLWRSSCLRTLTGHQGAVHAVAITADDARCLSGGADGTVRLWDAQTGAALRTLTGHTGAVNAVVFVAGQAPRGLSGGADGTLRLWDLATGAELRSFSGHAGAVNCLAVLPDGRQALSGGADGTLRLWDLEGGKLVRTLRLPGPADAAPGAVNCVGVTSDGRYAVSGGADGEVRIWDLTRGGRLRNTIVRHQAAIRALHLPSGSSVDAKGKIKEWKFAEPAAPTTPTPMPVASPEPSARPTRPAASPAPAATPAQPVASPKPEASPTPKASPKPTAKALKTRGEAIRLIFSIKPAALPFRNVACSSGYIGRLVARVQPGGIAKSEIIIQQPVVGQEITGWVIGKRSGLGRRLSAHTLLIA